LTRKTYAQSEPDIVKYWEIIADNPSKARWSWGCVSAIDSNGERFGLQTHIAATESVSLPDERRNLNELAFESDRREWDKRNLLPFQFHSRSLIGKR
jgi:hypothetical protein